MKGSFGRGRVNTVCPGGVVSARPARKSDVPGAMGTPWLMGVGGVLGDWDTEARRTRAKSRAPTVAAASRRYPVRQGAPTHRWTLARRGGGRGVLTVNKKADLTTLVSEKFSSQ